MFFVVFLELLTPVWEHLHLWHLQDLLFASPNHQIYFLEPDFLKFVEVFLVLDQYHHEQVCVNWLFRQKISFVILLVDQYSMNGIK